MSAITQVPALGGLPAGAAGVMIAVFGGYGDGAGEVGGWATGSALAA